MLDYGFGGHEVLADRWTIDWLVLGVGRTPMVAPWIIPPD